MRHQRENAPKFQNPKPKPQRKSKLQVPKSASEPPRWCSRLGAFFGIWNLEFVAFLRTRAPEAGLVHRRSRSEEHTSELQSHSDLVCRLLLEKKKIKKNKNNN